MAAEIASRSPATPRAKAPTGEDKAVCSQAPQPRRGPSADQGVEAVDGLARRDQTRDAALHGRDDHRLRPVCLSRASVSGRASAPGRGTAGRMRPRPWRSTPPRRRRSRRRPGGPSSSSSRCRVADGGRVRPRDLRYVSVRGRRPERRASAAACRRRAGGRRGGSRDGRLVPLRRRPRGRRSGEAIDQPVEPGGEARAQGGLRSGGAASRRAGNRNGPPRTGGPRGFGLRRA